MSSQAEVTGPDGDASSDQLSRSDYLAHMILDVYRGCIAEKVVFGSIIHSMPCMRSIMSELIEKERSGNKSEAAELFFNHLEASHEEGKFQSFVDALTEGYYTRLVSAINGEGVASHSHEHEELIKIFQTHIADKIDADIISQDLQSLRIITREDSERVRNLAHQKSQRDAAFELLQAIPRRKDDWYHQFLKVLLKHNHHQLVKFIDEKFYTENSPEELDEEEMSGELVTPLSSSPQNISDSRSPNISSENRPPHIASESRSPHLSSEAEDSTAGSTSAAFTASFAGGNGGTPDVAAELAEIKSMMKSYHIEVQNLREELQNFKVSVLEEMQSMRSILEKGNLNAGR